MLPPSDSSIATHRGVVTLPVVSDNEVLEAGHGWESGTETGRVLRAVQMGW